jgi:hypothetical protein
MQAAAVLLATIARQLSVATRGEALILPAALALASSPVWAVRQAVAGQVPELVLLLQALPPENGQGEHVT